MDRLKTDAHFSHPETVISVERTGSLLHNILFVTVPYVITVSADLSKLQHTVLSIIIILAPFPMVLNPGCKKIFLKYITDWLDGHSHWLRCPQHVVHLSHRTIGPVVLDRFATQYNSTVAQAFCFTHRDRISAIAEH